MKKFAVIVAGGIGTRMGAEVPKQFLVLKDKPILYYTLLKFWEEDASTDIRLVLPKEQMEYWNELCHKYSITVPHQRVNGGSTRFQSVKNGLYSIRESEGLVAIHDGVRPLVNVEVIRNCYKVAAEKGNAIAAVPSKDSIRVVTATESYALDRATCYIVQTPQTFKLSLLKKAFLQPETPLFTDDATVLEHAGETIHCVHSHYSNIKITTPEDLKWAHELL